MAESWMMDYDIAENHWIEKDKESVHKKIPVDVIKKMPQLMNLIKITSESYEYLDSDMKKEGFGIRQRLDME